ncbi:MAG: hypothetical protein FD177_1698 [Desulfovibrionaceae bacterium]|nr:MAG: hypothetical protein FD177_1698 [Desulfovibrionaceae bacterium]
MITVSVKMQPSTVSALKNAANKIGVPFPQLIRDSLFLALIHLDTSSQGAVRFKNKKAEEM